MYLLQSIIALLILIPMGIYLYFYEKRAVSVFYKKPLPKWVRGSLAVLSCLIVLPAYSAYRLWAVVMYHILFFFLVFDLLHRLLKRGKEKVLWETIYRLGVLPVLCTCLVFAYGHWNILNVVKQEYTIKTEKAISRDYRVAFISDVHFGLTLNQESLEKYCKEIEQNHPDLVVLGGDIVEEKTTKEEMHQVFETFGAIKSTYGTFYVYGNHDTNSYYKALEFTTEELNQVMEENHVNCISEKAVAINEEFTIVGRADRGHGKTSSRLSSSELIKGVDSDDFILLVDHQPVEMEENSENGYDLQLSGHTHAGQIFPVGVVTELLSPGKLYYGYRQQGKMQVIVTSGMAGWNFAVRTEGHSEYVIIDISRQ